MTRGRARRAALSIAWLGLAAGCVGEHAAPPASAPASAPAPVDGAGAAAEPGALATVAAVPADSSRAPGERRFEVASRTAAREAGHPRRFGAITLQTAMRSRTVGEYPCSSCHLGRNVVMRDKRIGDAHEDIRPVHPKETGAICATCHAADNVEQLPLKSGERATFDESYRLCAQCHFQQVDAWAAGGHGKRLDGWQGRRVVMGCADCHDPHTPGFEPRIPFRAPHLGRSEGQTHER
jgi:hypothetical protein